MGQGCRKWDGTKKYLWSGMIGMVIGMVMVIGIGRWDSKTIKQAKGMKQRNMRQRIPRR
jgi:hypothetical protein